MQSFIRTLIIRILITLALLAGAFQSPLAQDSAKVSAMAVMPPMGPPPQMKEIAYVVGVWDVAGQIFMDPASDNGMAFSAVATFEYALDSAAMLLHYSSRMMGMPYHGMSVTTFDRHKNQWQEVWLDNMSARISLMTGQQVDNHRIMQGADFYMGQDLLSRQTSYDITPTAFKWKFEQSGDDGKTWRTLMTAVYTKQP